MYVIYSGLDNLDHYKEITKFTKKLFSLWYIMNMHFHFYFLVHFMVHYDHLRPQNVPSLGPLRVQTLRKTK